MRETAAQEKDEQRRKELLDLAALVIHCTG